MEDDCNEKSLAANRVFGSGGGITADMALTVVHLAVALGGGALLCVVQSLPAGSALYYSPPGRVHL